MRASGLSFKKVPRGVNIRQVQGQGYARNQSLLCRRNPSARSRKPALRPAPTKKKLNLNTTPTRRAYHNNCFLVSTAVAHAQHIPSAHVWEITGSLVTCHTHLGSLVPQSSSISQQLVLTACSSCLNFVLGPHPFCVYLSICPIRLITETNKFRAPSQKCEGNKNPTSSFEQTNISDTPLLRNHMHTNLCCPPN